MCKMFLEMVQLERGLDIGRSYMKKTVKPCSRLSAACGAGSHIIVQTNAETHVSLAFRRKILSKKFWFGGELSGDYVWGDYIPSKGIMQL